MRPFLHPGLVPGRNLGAALRTKLYKIYMTSGHAAHGFFRSIFLHPDRGWIVSITQELRRVADATQAANSFDRRFDN